MSDPLLTALRRHFGFPAFRPGQHDALHLPGVTVVVSPLVALMKDHLDPVQSVAS